MEAWRRRWSPGWRWRLQLLWVHCVTDGPPVRALGVDQPPGDALASPPRRPSERLLSEGRQWTLVIRAVVAAAAVLTTGVIAPSWGWPDEMVRTQLLLSLLAVRLVLAYVSRTETFTFGSGWWRNRVLAVAIAGSMALQLPAFATGPGRRVLALSALPVGGWAPAGTAVLTTIVVIDCWRVVVSRRLPSADSPSERHRDKGP